MEVSEVVDAILTSFSYNRNDDDMLELIEELEKRVQRYRHSWSDDGNIAYGILVLLYGDYGTSPRNGWIEKDMEKILSQLRKNKDDIAIKKEMRND